jgi:hypothetical protein
MIMDLTRFFFTFRLIPAFFSRLAAKTFMPSCEKFSPSEARNTSLPARAPCCSRAPSRPRAWFHPS